MNPRHRMLVFDSAEPERLVRFWHELTGAEISATEPDWCSPKAPTDGGLRLGFQRVPEAKAVKNRVGNELCLIEEYP